MRIVHNEAFVRNASARLTPAELFPSDADLEGARHLATRWPSAAIREVSLVRAPVDRATRRVWLALESMQTTGSFKVRGAFLAIARRIEAARRAGRREPLEIVAASAGNHGAGVAYAAGVLGAKATVVVPSGAPRAKVDKIAAYGATVVRAASAGYDDAEREAIELASARGAELVSPYDDLDVLVGNGASLAFEIVRALGKRPDTVICPLGGSGLAVGMACALRHAAGSSTVPQVFGVQSEASCAFAQSLERGSAVVSLPPARTLADGLEGGISERAFARARAVLAGVVVATEAEIGRAMAYAYRDLGLVLEGSAAVALVPVLDGATHPGAALAAAPQEPEQEILDTVVVLTGRNVDLEQLQLLVR